MNKIRNMIVQIMANTNNEDTINDLLLLCEEAKKIEGSPTVFVGDNTYISPAIAWKIQELLVKEQKIQAIKLLREYLYNDENVRIGLKEAKNIVDKWSRFNVEVYVPF